MELLGQILTSAANNKSDFEMTKGVFCVIYELRTEQLAMNVD
jgi:hypothetical protein